MPVGPITPISRVDKNCGLPFFKNILQLFEKISGMPFWGTF